MGKWVAAVLAALLCALLVPATGWAVTPDKVDPFIDEGGVRDVKISPTGAYLAMSVRIDGQTGLMVMEPGQSKPLVFMRFARDTHVHDFWWVNEERVVMALAETFGTRDDPIPTGELYGMNADGGRKELLVGYRAIGPQTGSRIGVDREGKVAAFLVDPLPQDRDHVLLAVRPFSRDQYSRVERMNVYDGRRVRVASAPVAHADFVTDHQGRVRFTEGSLADNYSQLYHRKDDASPWELLNHEGSSDRVELPLGFAEGDAVAYLRVSQASGPDRIVALDTRTGERRDVLSDPVADPHPVWLRWTQPIGAWFLGAESRLAFFDEEHEESRLQHLLQRSFPGSRASVRSSTQDASMRVVLVESDVDPGSFYLFDTRAGRASLIVARDEQIDSTRMAAMKPAELKARDGLPLHGFITLPPGGADKGLPLVVMPHGGPFGIFDAWGFNPDAQLLAASGYAVLQVNFRGSGNYGRAFRRAGARQWGTAMQDDVTDATRWAIEQGYADPQRICIYGASYGAYAALMGVAREPSLYRCAIGYVGVYDLPLMKRDLVERSRSSTTWAREWIGEDEVLAAASPVRLAGQVQAPVFLAAGGEDFIAPIDHTKRMEAALKRSGVEVEALYYPNEGHGFYETAHRREFYARMLQFLGRHIGDRRG
jgi:dipeptidyl aminopeptidase/acylaminoacyl peptidase